MCYDIKNKMCLLAKNSSLSCFSENWQGLQIGRISATWLQGYEVLKWIFSKLCKRFKTFKCHFIFRNSIIFFVYQVLMEAGGFSVWFTTSLVCRVEVMKGLVLLVASLLPISIEALLCRVCSSTLNGNQVSGVCENQGDNGRLVLCREGFHSCYYRFDQTSKY